MAEPLDELRNVHDIQGRHGNWNYGPGMLGFYNGLELALSIFEGRDPAFRDWPDVWLKDIPIPEGATVETIAEASRD